MQSRAATAEWCFSYPSTRSEIALAAYSTSGANNANPHVHVSITVSTRPHMLHALRGTTRGFVLKTESDCTNISAAKSAPSVV
jgi:hypothetical protein